MTTERFDATIISVGTRAGILLPFDPNDAWGERPRHHVAGSVGSRAVRGPLARVDARWILPLGPVWLRDNGLAVGDPVPVSLSPEGPQADALADDIAAALAADPPAKAFFDGLATFYRKGYVHWIEAAKRPATRASRLAAMIESLRAGRKQR